MQDAGCMQRCRGASLIRLLASIGAVSRLGASRTSSLEHTDVANVKLLTLGVEWDGVGTRSVSMVGRMAIFVHEHLDALLLSVGQRSLQASTIWKLNDVEWKAAMHSHDVRMVDCFQPDMSMSLHRWHARTRTGSTFPRAHPTPRGSRHSAVATGTQTRYRIFSDRLAAGTPRCGCV